MNELSFGSIILTALISIQCSLSPPREYSQLISLLVLCSINTLKCPPLWSFLSLIHLVWVITFSNIPIANLITYLNYFSRVLTWVFNSVPLQNMKYISHWIIYIFSPDVWPFFLILEQLLLFVFTEGENYSFFLNKNISPFLIRFNTKNMFYFPWRDVSFILSRSFNFIY